MKRSAEKFTCRKALVDEIIALRARELRAGKPIDSARFPEDTLDSTLHFGAWNRELLIGCLTLIANAGTRAAGLQAPSWQLRGMATASDWKRLGVGKTLLLFAETKLRQLAVAEMDKYAHDTSEQIGKAADQDGEVPQQDGGASEQKVEASEQEVVAHGQTGETHGQDGEAHGQTGEVSSRKTIKIWCNARVAAVPFYKKMGYRIVSDLFHIEHVGPHYKMEKFLDVRSG